METRKVQQVGGGTYTVSIPISWAEEHEIQAGGTAYLYTHCDGSLVVRWGEREEGTLGAVDVDLDGRHDGAVATRTLNAAYTTGFERITLHTTDAAQREAIRDRARTLVGVDVAEESDEHVEVGWLLDASGLSIDQSVRQLRFVAGSMFDAALATFAGATAEAGYITDRTEETDRLARLVERQFTRAMVLFEELDRLDATRPQLFAQYRATRELERVAADAAEIGRAVRQSGPAASTELAEEIQTVGDEVHEAVEAAADTVTDGGSTATAHEALDRAGAATEEARRLHRTVATEEPPSAVLFTRVLDGVLRIAGHAKAIGEVALERAVRP
ncbi:phosphate uptake regulator PhoU [Halolamina sp. CBA1230]|uniref:AbrB/MazE/SpoVT family DNA-binding domain-containing protein n=1 Tax=Halolamina sp. CBA1230 TaxID=1853690 RepID=UPI0009A15DC8|nr:phosphate uptake regulator PhoU [Halolamina sp. CBA1230]QKY19114.1 phosphate uptake regulator PhoU [Halolamina sp. CBA1230]